jgi:ABC-type multidrug transport system fused ATPase/permease subunit
MLSPGERAFNCWLPTFSRVTDSRLLAWFTGGAGKLRTGGCERWSSTTWLLKASAMKTLPAPSTAMPFSPTPVTSGIGEPPPAGTSSTSSNPPFAIKRFPAASTAKAIGLSPEATVVCVPLRAETLHYPAVAIICKEDVAQLRGVDLEVHSGEIVMLVGPSGNGKTTLVSIMGCILQASSGSIRIASQEVGHLRKNELPRVRLDRIGFVFGAAWQS